MSLWQPVPTLPTAPVPSLDSPPPKHLVYLRALAGSCSSKWFQLRAAAVFAPFRVLLSTQNFCQLLFDCLYQIASFVQREEVE